MPLAVRLRQLLVNATNLTARLCSKDEAPQKEIAAEVDIVVSVRSVFNPCAVAAGGACFEGSRARYPLCLLPPTAECNPKLTPRERASNYYLFHVSSLLNSQGKGQVV